MKIRRIKASRWVRVIRERDPITSLMQQALVYKGKRLVYVIQRYFRTDELLYALQHSRWAAPHHAVMATFSRRATGKSWVMDEMAREYAARVPRSMAKTWVADEMRRKLDADRKHNRSGPWSSQSPDIT